MPTTAARRIPALLTALAAAGLLFAPAPPSQAAPARAATPAKSLAPALPTPGASSVVCKLGQALIEEYDARFDLRTETYRDEIETASAVTTKTGPAKG